ncbi:MAG: electron transport complex subunit RsxC [Methylophilus sp.]|nr:electron transport complex subunit RsxC [Methylophilus sp.]
MNALVSLGKIFKFNGGVHPPENKAQSTQLPIAKLSLPASLVLPLRQHVGNIPKVKVSVGDHVLKGQLLAEAEGMVSAAIHAPTSGTITAIAEAIIPHPSGLPDHCITLQPDGLDTWIDHHGIDWRNTDKRTLVNSLRLSGIVGLGGATFPTHVKLNADGRSGVHTLVINAAECEPYITCDDMLMRERATEIVQGIAIAQHLLGATQVLIGIEDNKPEAIAAMQQAIANSTMQVVVVPTLYPSGDARRLVHLLLGEEIPYNKRATEVGIQVFNVATVLALHRFFDIGEPSISRIVSMTGNVSQPRNFEVLFGTPLMHLVDAAGGAKPDTTHFIMGGPMMGFNLPEANVPITKAANCIIAASPNLFAPPPPAMPCIRCARCADACPVSLQPQELYWFAKSDNFEKARDYKLFDCIECGACSYVCPSDIPLVQYYRYAKSEIIAADKAKEAADLARERNEARLARIEREKLERAQKHAERAQAAKTDANKDLNTGNQQAVRSETSEATQATPADANDAKKVAIAAAIERAKAQKLNSTAELKSDVAKPAQASTESQTDASADEAKKAAIAAAIARAKAQKAAALQSGVAPKNVEAASTSVQQEIAEIDARRQAVGITPVEQPPQAQADKQAAIAAAIARAKAQKAAAEAAKAAETSEKKD